MIAFCRQKYADSPADLNHVEEFEEYYQSSCAIFWYTRDIFLYHLMNKVLREQDIETIYSLRYFIKDLYQQLQERYKSEQSSSILTVSTKNMVYRGQLMRNEEFNRKIRDNIGGFFSINSFLSTTQNRYLALIYAGINNLSETSKEQGVLFEIPIDTSIDKFSYADISNDSIFEKAESEVLFTMSVIFRINSVTRDNSAGIWIVSLKISDEEDAHVHLISPIIQKDLTKPYRPLIKLVKIKYSNIASVCRKKEYYQKALENYMYCLDIELERFAPNDKELLITKNNIGIVHIYLENYIEAIRYFQEMIEAEKNSSRNPGINYILAVAYWNMACAFYQQRQLEKALEYSQKCQHIITNNLVIVFHELEAKECQEWIQRIRYDLLKQPLQIRKGYGPEPWRIAHRYRPSFDLD